MIHYTCTAAIGRLFTRNVREGSPSHGLQVEVESDLESDESQHTRYAPCFPMSYQLSKTQPTRNRPSTLVHLLDDDSLLIIFSFCRPVILDQSEVEGDHQLIEGGKWNRERWWYRLIQVCRRWRYIVLDSAFHLQVSLVCGRGTPVADMLAHSPPVPLIIDHIDEEYDVLTPEDEEGIILALQHRDRIRRIRITKSNSILQKLVIALGGEFPILEYLLISNRRDTRPFIDLITSLSFPESFRTPHLRHLCLDNFATPIESPILTTMANLVTLWLSSIPSSGYFHPNALLQRLSLMPQLETLGIGFHCYNSRRDIEEQLLRTPITTQVRLPNLHWLMFDGTSDYLEALLPWLTIPLLKRLDIHFFNQMVYSIPHLRQLTNTAGNLRLKVALVNFREDLIRLSGYPDKGARLTTLYMGLGGRHLDWQVVSAAQVFHALKTVFSAVEHLDLRYSRHNISSEWNNQADLLHWREVLGSFGKVKTLRVEYGLVEQVSRAIQPEGDSPTELFPELQELSYSRRVVSRAFALFIDARQKAGRPLTVNHI